MTSEKSPMASEKSASRFIESGVLQPPSPTADAATLKRLEAGDHGTQKTSEWPTRKCPPSRSAHSSYSGTPAAMQIPDAAAADLPVVSCYFFAVHLSGFVSYRRHQLFIPCMLILLVPIHPCCGTVDIATYQHIAACNASSSSQILTQIGREVYCSPCNSSRLVR
jgi:hypothetical protein